MNLKTTLRMSGGLLAVVLAVALGSEQSASGQRGGGAPGGGQGGGRGQAVASNLPTTPTAVTLPRMEKVTGPGAMYDSSPAQWPGRDMAHFKYVATEYFVSGTANGAPYTTRVVVRQPADNARFSGLIVAEPMHPIGAAHAFEYNSVYIMDSGHIAVEIATAGTQNFTNANPERYSRIQVANGQAPEILAQVGALVKSANGPLAGLAQRKMILWGTSASSGILVNYLPAHQVFRTPAMTHIYDGFMPTSNGGNIQPVDVPMIQVPTQHEYERVATTQQDGDAAGEQFRVYEFAGLGHLDARNNPRFNQSQCQNPMTTFPNEAYFSVALHHLLQWVDKGIAPPKAERVINDRYAANDGSLMLLDEHGNARGGVRNPYVDVPVVKYTARNTGTAPAGPRGGGGMNPAALCNLSVWETPIPQARLRQMYGSKDAYVQKFEARLNELEKAGWSLPVYHDLILADARKVNF